MHEKTTLSPEQLARLRKSVFIVIAIPLVPAVLFTLMQWYPATYAINYMDNGNGEYPVKSTILLNWGALMLIELAVILLALPVVKLIRARSQR